MAREGLVRFTHPALATPDATAAWLERLAALLRRLEARDTWNEAAAAATRERGDQLSGDAETSGHLKGMNTIADVASFVRIHPRSVARAIHRGDLEVVRAGNMIRISDDAVYAWLTKYATQRPPPRRDAPPSK